MEILCYKEKLLDLKFQNLEVAWFETYVFFFSSSNLRERSSKSMSSDAEVLAPADAVGSVSGTDGNSGSTKLS